MVRVKARLVLIEARLIRAAMYSTFSTFKHLEVFDVHFDCAVRIWWARAGAFLDSALLVAPCTCSDMAAIFGGNLVFGGPKSTFRGRCGRLERLYFDVRISMWSSPRSDFGDVWVLRKPAFVEGASGVVFGERSEWLGGLGGWPGKGTRKLGTCWGRRVRRGKVF